MVTAQGERDRLARLIENTFFAHYDGGRSGQACLYWAHFTVEVLKALGIRAIIQAGSASWPWPRLRPDQDDGVSPTHHSYVWEPDSVVTKGRLAADAMPAARLVRHSSTRRDHRHDHPILAGAVLADPRPRLAWGQTAYLLLGHRGRAA